MFFVPSVFDDDDLNLFRDVAGRPFFKANASLMNTDVQKKDGKYLLDVDLPGFSKDDIKVSLKDGVLSIEAAKNQSRDEKDDNGTVIRQERFSGTCSRSFYVGDKVKESDIKASYKDGVLHLEVQAPEAIEHQDNNYIAIE